MDVLLGMFFMFFGVIGIMTICRQGFDWLTRQIAKNPAGFQKSLGLDDPAPAKS